MKKFILAVGLVAAMAASVFALDDDALTGGFGVGFGGAFFNNTVGSGKDGDINLRKDTSYNATTFDFIDIEGRLIFNSINIALMGRFSFGLGGLQAKELFNGDEAGLGITLGTWLGAGYRIKLGNLHLIPSFIMGYNYAGGAKTFKVKNGTQESNLEVVTASGAFVLGGDLAAIYRVGNHFGLEASCLVTVNMGGICKIEMTSDFPGASKSEGTVKLKGGDVSFLPKVGLFWLF